MIDACAPESTACIRHSDKGKGSETLQMLSKLSFGAQEIKFGLSINAHGLQRVKTQTPVCFPMKQFHNSTIVSKQELMNWLIYRWPSAVYSMNILWFIMNIVHSKHLNMCSFMYTINCIINMIYQGIDSIIIK